MTVFSVRQVVPVDYEAEVSQRLLEATLAGDLKSATECIADPYVDVNFVGAVSLKTRKTEVVLREGKPSEVRVEFEEFKSDVTALFLAAHSGNVTLVKKLLSTGADVNQKLFRGFATTIAVREGHLEILEILLKAGASQPACEEALLEASCHGQARLAELLMGSDLIRPHVAVHSLVTACCRGFVDVVDTLMKAGAKTDMKVRLGAWSWDTTTGEEFRVGAGLAEPYAITWCAVEYFEITGSILRMLLQHLSYNSPHYGRTLLHHAILCGCTGAVAVLLSCGADAQCPIRTQKTEFHPIHLAARLGFSTILQSLIDSGCDLNTKTESGETALMISAKYKQEECVKVLAKVGADFGLVSVSGQSASSIAGSNWWSVGFQRAVLDTIRSGNIPKSSNVAVFSPLMFIAQAGDIAALKALIGREELNLDYQDDNGFSAVMVAASKGHVEVFRELVYAGADVKLLNKSGKTAIMLSELNQNCDLFEKVMLEFALEKGNRNAGGFYALHCAARRGDLDAVRLLTSRGYGVNVPDGDGYTPLMLAAREGHGPMCELLISNGAVCDIKNARGETALSLARKNSSMKNDAELVILDEVARMLVLGGGHVLKHTKGGKGTPHRKDIRMLGSEGVLRWGNSRRRNVICREAKLGPSPAFQKNRRGKGDVNEPGVFHIVTTKNNEVHFVCQGGLEMAELWVRGIMLVTKAAMHG
ncbi:ankyrin-3 isoform X2 [Citrus clementina]|uniref:ankyrin-3 isoform X2 n=1 Tax=Citrus clementina TaxID=85681 RepID=UPI000CED1134|nr:ankyrin-3 isoform X2 [Citrus x clementina]